MQLNFQISYKVLYRIFQDVMINFTLYSETRFHFSLKQFLLELLQGPRTFSS